MTMVNSGNYDRLYASGGTVTATSDGFSMSGQRPRATRVALSVDIGGTFTDAVVEDGDQYHTVKVLTTPRDPSAGFVTGALRALGVANRKPEDVRIVMHGTTLATNAILERRGAKTGFLTTEGFRDVLDIGDEGRHDQYDLFLEKTKALIPRQLRLTVRQRHRYDGSELQSLHEEDVKKAAVEFRAAGVESIAVGFMHSHVNNTHEERAATILRTELPGVHVCTSSSVCPEIREYERFSTVAANAYVQPLMTNYLSQVTRRLEEVGIKCPMLIMTSGGGLTDLWTAASLPVRLIESGPAGGVMLAEWAAKEVAASKLLSLDMGGTTAKICFLEKQHAAVARDFEVDRAARFRKRSGLPVRIPCLDLVEISGGGGSIARTNAVGAVVIGPDSAGAEPGPACYGRGGSSPTVTDADFVLGHIDPQLFASGEVKLQLDQARTALQNAVTVPQGFASEFQAAHTVVEMVDETMANAARMKAAEQGRELEGYALVAFGGAAPLHAARVAEKLGLATVLVPPNAGVGSAIGFLSAPLAFEAVRSRPMKLSEFDARAVNNIFKGLFHETVAPLAAGAARFKPGNPARERKRAYGRYVGQGHEVCLEVPIDDLEQEDVGLLRKRFDDAYMQLFARAVPGGEIEILTWVLSLTVDSDPRMCGQSPWARHTTGAAATKKARRCTRLVFDNTLQKHVEVPVLFRDELHSGFSVAGPVVIVEPHTSTVVTGTYVCSVLPNGFLRLERQHQPSLRTATITLAGALPPSGSKADKEDDKDKTVGRIEIQMMWARLLAYAEEQAEILLRTAFAPVVRESGYLSCGIFDQRGQMLAHSVTGTPGLANCLAEAVSHFIARFPLESLHEGDALVSNDPWLATGSLNDFIVVTPIFMPGSTHGTPVGLVASTAHLTDVGGGHHLDANDVRDIHMEGIRIPPVHLARKGVINADLIIMLQANVRRPHESVGDVYALLTCNGVAVARVSEMIVEFGVTGLDALSEYILNASHSAVLRNIEALPRGEWTNEAIVDSNGGDVPLKLVSTLKIMPNSVSVDFSGTGSLSAKAFNVPLAYTRAYTSFALSCLVARDVPNNAGSLKAFSICVPKGCVLHADYPCAVSARHVVGQLLPDLVLGCLAKCLPSRIPAEGASAVCRISLFRPGGPSNYGQSFTATALENGGTGARPSLDGLSATSFPSGIRSTPVEITETAAPVLFRRKEFRPDSGGAGRQRGGLGLHLEIESAYSAADFSVVATLERTSNPAVGRHGGLPGALASLRRSDGNQIRAMGVQHVPAGVRLLIDTAGGGGFGPPDERDRKRLRQDVLEGFVSLEEARQTYGATIAELEMK